MQRRTSTAAPDAAHSLVPYRIVCPVGVCAGSCRCASLSQTCFQPSSAMRCNSGLALVARSPHEMSGCRGRGLPAECNLRAAKRLAVCCGGFLWCLANVNTERAGRCEVAIGRGAG